MSEEKKSRVFWVRVSDVKFRLVRAMTPQAARAYVLNKIDVRPATFDDYELAKEYAIEVEDATQVAAVQASPVQLVA